MSRGVTVPPRGSPRDLVLRELLNRERAERAAEISLLVRLVGAVAGLDGKRLDKAIETYVRQLTHDVYRDPPDDGRLSPEDEARIARVSALNSGE